MSETTDLLSREISARRAKIDLLEREVAALETSLEILAQGDRQVIMNGLTTRTESWRDVAVAFMADGKDHGYREVAEVVTAKHPDLNPKTVHLWLSGLVKTEKAEKVSRGRYRMR